MFIGRLILVGVFASHGDDTGNGECCNMTCAEMPFRDTELLRHSLCPFGQLNLWSTAWC